MSAPGRPRDENARAAILTAAQTLFAESGYDTLSVAEIAQRAGVGKQTVYRWWPSKAAVLAEAILDDSTKVADLTLKRTPNGLRADLRSWSRGLETWLHDERGAALFFALASASAEDAGLTQQLNRAFGAPLHNSLADALADESPSLAPDLIADMIVGTFILRAFQRSAPMNDQELDSLIDFVLTSLSARTS
ncbi:TetR/AcrR family transcriptional regulator [Subtercola endophyticus]|uniref:TetR/AcrR family transcriptional regulator n=1 Tax=Subtercola endophyticus TaxID=2895559 RepID=UPI001E2A1CE8|nr:TetR/AcrR family transcriptional regulator [Subtercola endophyticus]UFS59931.1 TetR/AcrR family transcriptional regulator [Subtercola endophyticus]